MQPSACASVSVTNGSRAASAIGARAALSLSLMLGARTGAEEQQGAALYAPSSGVIHLVYGAPDTIGSHTWWIDCSTREILQVRGADVTLRMEEGLLLRGSAFDDMAAGTPGDWTSETNNTAALLGLPCPLAQAVLLAAERSRVSVVGSGEREQVIQWQSPPFKVWKWSPEQEASVEVDGSQRVVFHVSPDGRILSWQNIVDAPDVNIGPVQTYDYRRVVDLAGVSLPRYWDREGKGRTTPGDGVLELQTAELVDSAPEGAFTREGALRVARDIAQPMVEAERSSYRWYGGPDGESAAEHDVPFVDPTRKAQGPSWSTAFITGGVIVLALGGFAWWRSRR